MRRWQRGGVVPGPGFSGRRAGAGLAARHREVTAGITLVHPDAGDDAFLVTADGGACLTGWTFPGVGAEGSTPCARC